MMPAMRWIVLVLVCPILFFVGCTATHRVSDDPARDLLAQAFDADVEARVTPPIGWQVDPIKRTTKHVHKTWISPSRDTAYGIIKFDLPLPVPYDVVMWGFLDGMRKTEGAANLVGKQWDNKINGLRFVASGKIYLVRVNMFIDGFHGWAVYAGTLQAHPVNEDELKIAEAAREHTAVGRK